MTVTMLLMAVSGAGEGLSVWCCKWSGRVELVRQDLRIPLRVACATMNGRRPRNGRRSKWTGAIPMDRLLGESDRRVIISMMSVNRVCNSFQY